MGVKGGFTGDRSAKSLSDAAHSPGPGEYSLDAVARGVKGGKIAPLANISPRRKAAVQSPPGPGEYHTGLLAGLGASRTRAPAFSLGGKAKIGAGKGKHREESHSTGLAVEAVDTAAVRSMLGRQVEGGKASSPAFGFGSARRSTDVPASDTPGPGDYMSSREIESFVPPERSAAVRSAHAKYALLERQRLLPKASPKRNPVRKTTNM